MSYPRVRGRKDIPMSHRLVTVTAAPAAMDRRKKACIELQAKRVLEASPDLSVVITGGQGGFNADLPDTVKVIHHPEIPWNREILVNQAVSELTEEELLDDDDYLLILNYNVFLQFPRVRELLDSTSPVGCVQPFDDARRLSDPVTERILDGNRSIVLARLDRTPPDVPFAPFLVKAGLFKYARGLDEMLPYHVVAKEFLSRMERLGGVTSWPGLKAFELNTGGTSRRRPTVNREITQRLGMVLEEHIREVDSRFLQGSDSGTVLADINDAEIKGDPRSDTAVVTIHQGRDPVRVGAHTRSMNWWLKQRGDIHIYIGEVVLDGGEAALQHWVDIKQDPRLHLTVLRGNERDHGTLFQKEAVLNEVTVNSVPKEVKYLLYIDADGWTDDPIWFLQMRRHLQLKPYSMLQGFSHLQDTREPSFIRNSYAKYRERQDPNGWYAPGFVWAMTRESFNRRCGWNPFGIVGCGDLLHLRECGGVLPPRAPSRRWLTDAMRPGHPEFPIDYLPKRVWHEYHGPHTNRKYALRELIPDLACRRIFDEVTRDESNGLIRWINPDSPLRKALDRLPELRSGDDASKLVTSIAGSSDPFSVGEERRKPAFVVAGVMKSGSTAALLNLSKHPHIWACRRDEQFNLARDTTCWAELHYWDRDYNHRHGMDWYLDFFQQAPKKALFPGEHSPNIAGGVNCLEDPLDRIASEMPELKLIFLLRNPVERFYSHWHHVFVAFPERPYIEFQAIVGDRDCPSWSMIHAPGRYDELIEKTRDRGLQCLFLVMERVQASPMTEYRKACSFLGADPSLLPRSAGQVYRRIVRSDKRDPLPSDLRTVLVDSYRESVERVRDLLNDPIPEWREDFDPCL